MKYDRVGTSLFHIYCAIMQPEWVVKKLLLMACSINKFELNSFAKSLLGYHAISINLNCYIRIVRGMCSMVVQKMLSINMHRAHRRSWNVLQDAHSHFLKHPGKAI